MQHRIIGRRATCVTVATIVAGLLAFPGASRGETIQSAQSAKALLGDVLDYITELVASSDEGLTLKLDGEASAQPVGQSVEMIFPSPSIVEPNGSGFHLGNVSASVTPQQKDSYEFSLDLPGAVTISDATGVTEGRIEWSGSAVRGIWRADFDTTTVLHSKLKNVRFVDVSSDKEEIFGNINSVALDQQLEKSANGWWGGPFTFDVLNIKITPPGKTDQISLEKISMSGNFQDFDLAGWQALSEWGSTLSIPKEGSTANSFGNSKAAASIFEAINLGAGITRLQVSDLRYGPPGLKQFKMAGLAVDMSYDNGARPGAYSLAIDWDDLEQNDSDIPPAFFTHTGSMKLHLEQFPLRQILTQSLRQHAPTGPVTGNKFGNQLQGMILPLINANQTSLRLEELVLESSVAAVAASGTISAREASALGVVGEARVEIAGLDKLIANTAREAVTGTQAPEFLAFLTFAKGLGRPEVGDDGKLVYIFDIVLPADGIVQINDIPLNLLQNSGTTALPPASHS